MASLSTQDVLTALACVKDGDGDVVARGMISGVAVHAGKVGFVITIAPQERAAKAHLREECERAVKALPGVESVTVVMTAQSVEPGIQSAEFSKAKQELAAAKKPAVFNTSPIEGVKQVIAVASGKGGVGKSTCAVSIARALTAKGKRVGLLDADIYGPSLPRMLGLMGAGQPALEHGKMVPPRSGGIACMSMQFITGEQAAVLRAPMVTKALNQMLRFTDWRPDGAGDSALDLLLVDMPPGTGDIHLSLVQQVKLAGVIIVTTPQEVALMDARKCAQMFAKVGVPVLGVVENMAGEIFGSGGGAALARELGAPLLGSVPLAASIRKAGDEGAAEFHQVFEMISAALSA